MPRVVVVGAGISGLATAYALQKRIPSAEILPLESESRIGGTIWSERRDGFLVEHGPNGFLDTKPSTVQLCRDLELDDALLPAGPAARHRYLFHNDRLVRLPEGIWSFLTTPLLSWRSKWAVLTERFRPPRMEDADESVHDFFRRRTTEEIAETLADALVTGIHAGDPKMLSMAAAFPRLAALEKEHGSLLRGMKHLARERRRLARETRRPPSSGSRILSFRDGLRKLIEVLQSKLKTPPLVGATVKRVFPNETGQWSVEGQGRDRWAADAVILACPAYRQAEIVADLDPELADLLRGIAYAPAIVVALGYRREDVPHSLDGFGHIVPQRHRADLLGSQWCSSIFPDRAAPGCVLLRAICGGWHRKDIAAWDDNRLLEAVRQHYRHALGIEKPPVFHQIVRWPLGIPQYHLGHVERVHRIEKCTAKHRGLFLTGNALHGVAMNDCTEQAEITAGRVAAYLAGADR
ncbi:MAG: protoporphyrinogen oxidase [Gemmatales bacterium]|nr:protoporphyrinogen oxidase [Gemmatales bacterium]MDW8385687.1 protoporphyrinogen oxidase [Gemmatales bacterium]